MARKLLHLRSFEPHILGNQSIRYFVRGRPPGEASTLKDRLEMIRQEELGKWQPVNIGFKQPKLSRRDTISVWMEEMKERRRDSELERKSRCLELDVDMEKVEELWSKTAGPNQIHRIAEHYGIFKDLFGEGYFLPVLPLNIEYDLRKDDTFVKVYRGNVIKSYEASIAPGVSYKADPESLWTLLMTTPDCNLSNPENEYCHWFIGNIPGNQIEKGQRIMDYLRPIPPRGIGYCRYIFVLYKQSKSIDYSEYQKSEPCVSLEERDWNTLRFYRKHESLLTPAGLAFFQADWDESLINFYHDTLNMPHPVFQYDFPQPYTAKQVWFPKRLPFNLYLDKYRDPKEINKEFLLKRLRKVHPLKPPEKPFKYPGAQAIPQHLPSWLKVEIKKERLGWGHVNRLNDE